MAKTRQTPDPAVWTSRLNVLREQRKQRAELDWHRSLAMYFPKYRVAAEVDWEHIRVDLPFAHVKILLRSAYGGDPYVYVRPLRLQEGWIESAELLETLVNDLWRSKGRKRAMRQVILNTILYKKGYGISRVGSHWLERRSRIMMENVSPWYLWMDGNTVEDSYMIIRGVPMPWAHAKEMFNVDLPLASQEELFPWRHGYAVSNVPQDTSETQQMVKDVGRVMVYEIHDQLNEMIYMIHPGHDKFLRTPEEHKYISAFGGSQFTELEFNEVPGEQVGIGDLEPVSHQFAKINDLREAMVVHVKRFTRKYLMERKNAKQDALDALSDGEDGTIAIVEDIEKFKEVKDAPMSVDVWNLEGVLKQDLRETAGIDEMLRAGAVKGAGTAYETSQIVAGRNLRMGEKPDLVGDFIEEVSFKDIEIMKNFYDEAHVAQITRDPMAPPEWREIKRGDLQGRHFVRLHAGSTIPIDETTEWQKGVALYQQYAQDPMVSHVKLLQIAMALQRVPQRSALIVDPHAKAQTRQPGVNPFSQAHGEGRPGMGGQPEIIRRLFSGNAMG